MQIAKCLSQIVNTSKTDHFLYGIVLVISRVHALADGKDTGRNETMTKMMFRLLP